MTTHLDIALGIADLVNDAVRSSEPLDLDRHVRSLLEVGAPSPLTPTIVASVLKSESEDAGVPVCESDGARPT
ncbi:hypothetical protein [Aureimonas sp. AU22]|uniref:hypothetical protein n=1 Tax=Aureimonas sp. AU22 TaxID=1638162 RepID=UPI0007859CAE|nr:hypothetical protein [Aureimonas sp. AU22]